MEIDEFFLRSLEPACRPLVAWHRHRPAGDGADRHQHPQVLASFVRLQSGMRIVLLGVRERYRRIAMLLAGAGVPRRGGAGRTRPREAGRPGPSSTAGCNHHRSGGRHPPSRGAAAWWPAPNSVVVTVSLPDLAGGLARTVLDAGADWFDTLLSTQAKWDAWRVLGPVIERRATASSPTAASTPPAGDHGAVGGVPTRRATEADVVGASGWTGSPTPWLTRPSRRW